MNIKSTIMDIEVIKQLLEKYYEGSTSLSEETLLREFFSSKNVPEELRDEKEIFNFYRPALEIPEPSEDFEKRIISAIDSEVNDQNRILTRRRIALFSGIAAGLLILTATYFFLFNSSGLRDTYTDPEIAYSETIKILYNVSARMNNATMRLQPLGKLDEVTGKSLNLVGKQGKIVEEEINSLSQISRSLKSADKLKNEKQLNN